MKTRRVTSRGVAITPRATAPTMPVAPAETSTAMATVDLAAAMAPSKNMGSTTSNMMVAMMASTASARMAGEVANTTMVGEAARTTESIQPSVPFAAMIL